MRKIEKRLFRIHFYPYNYAVYEGTLEELYELICYTKHVEKDYQINNIVEIYYTDASLQHPRLNISSDKRFRAYEAEYKKRMLK